jgi:probable HAF family extracellular repeat protein
MALLAMLPTLAIGADKYTAVDVTPAGSLSCGIAAINTRGQVVGRSLKSDGVTELGFITGDNGASPRDISPLAGHFSYLQGLNDKGQAVGESTIAEGSTDHHAIFVEANSSTPVDLGTFGGPFSYATKINNKGRIVGGAMDATGQAYGFITNAARVKTKLLADLTPMAVSSTGVIAGAVYDPKTYSTNAVLSGPNAQSFSTLGTLGGSLTFGMTMNSSYQVVGFAANADYSWYHAFITDANGANLRDLGVGGTFSIAKGINDKGRIVGQIQTDWSVPSRAFIFSAGKSRDLATLVTLPDGDLPADATGINNLGQISVNSLAGRCYVLTPI